MSTKKSGNDVSGIYSPTGQQVSFCKSWGNHEFTKEELKSLLDGETIVFPAVTKSGKKFDASGKLMERNVNGHKYWGFQFCGSVKQAQTNRMWLNSLSGDAYSDFMKMFQTLNVKKYIDFAGWLDSTERKFQIQGEEAVLMRMFQKPCYCTVVERGIIKNGKSHSKVVIDHGNNEYEISVAPDWDIQFK